MPETEDLDGRLNGWPVSVQLLRYSGIREVTVSLAPYTGEKDEPAPHEVWQAVYEYPRTFASKSQAMAALKQLGFVAGEL